MFGRFVFGTRALRAAIIVVFAARIGLAARDASADAAEAKKIFTTRCMACHTFGKGVKVGPDLKGVTERRQRPWIVKFVQQSSVVIASGDPIATDLFAQFKGQRMPDWTDLSEAQINSILDWLGINGPDQKEIDERLAESATVAEIETGRQLFTGEKPLTNGGTACGSCHSIHDATGSVGGSFADDLTTAFTQFQDGAMTQFLRHPCFQREPESSNATFLTPAELFYLKGYLRQTVAAQLPDTPAHDGSGSGSDKAAPAVAKAVDSSGPTAGGTPPAGQPAPGASKRVPWAERSADISGTPRLHGARIQGALLFVALPFIALLVLVLGIALRFAVAQRRPENLTTRTNAAWKLFSGGTAWRVGLVLTVALHLLALVLPTQVLAWNAAPMRLYLLEGSALLFTVIALIGWVQIMRHHLSRPAGARHTLGEIADTVLLSLFGLALASGLITAVAYRWSSSWSAGTLAPYFASLIHGEPATALVEELPFMARLHVLSWFAVMVLVPFTSAALLLVAVLHRILLVVARPFEAIADASRRAAAKLSPARWLWPEEDAVELVGKADNAQEPS